jgi:hypothetical protein
MCHMLNLQSITQHRLQALNWPDKYQSRQQDFKFKIHAVRRGGETSITPSPRTKRNGMARLVACKKNQQIVSKTQN